MHNMHFSFLKVHAELSLVLGPLLPTRVSVHISLVWNTLVSQLSPQTIRHEHGEIDLARCASWSQSSGVLYPYFRTIPNDKTLPKSQRLASLQRFPRSATATMNIWTQNLLWRFVEQTFLCKMKRIWWIYFTKCKRALQATKDNGGSLQNVGHKFQFQCIPIGIGIGWTMKTNIFKVSHACTQLALTTGLAGCP